MAGNENELSVAIVARDRSAKTFAAVARNANTLHGKLVRLGSGMQSVGRSMTLGLTLPLVAVGAASVKLSLEFEDSMKKIQGLVMGGTAESGAAIEKFKQQILELAPAVGKAPAELADALYQITSSGFAGADAMSILKASAKASSAGLGETKTVADALTTALNVYESEGLKAAYATDVLTAAVREGKMEPEEMAGNIGKVLSMAKLAKVEFEEVAGALAGMSLAGIKTDEAAVALNQALTAINKPSDQMIEAADKLGIKFADLRDVIADDGLVEGFRLMYDNSQKLGKDALPTMIKALGNVRAARAVFALMGLDAAKLDGIMSGVAASTGDTDAAFKSVAEGSGFKMQKALSQLKAAGIKIGDELLPILADVAGGAEKIASAFSRLPGWATKAAVSIGVVVAALGPLAYLTGSAAKGLGTLLAVKQTGVRAALMGLSGVASGGVASGGGAAAGAALAGAATLAGPIAAITVLGGIVASGAIAGIVVAGKGLPDESLSDAGKAAAAGYVNIHDHANAGEGIRKWRAAEQATSVAAAVKEASSVIDALGAKAATATGKQFDAIRVQMTQIKALTDAGFEFGDIKADKTDGQLRSIRDRIMSELGITRKQADRIMATMFKDWRPQDVLGPRIDKAAAKVEARMNVMRARVNKDIKLGKADNTDLINKIAQVERAFNRMGSAARTAGDAAVNAVNGGSYRGHFKANGGIIYGPQAVVVGEAGPEAIVPLTRPRRAAEILAQAGLVSSGGSVASGRAAVAAPATYTTIVQLDGYEIARYVDGIDVTRGRARARGRAS